MFSYGLIKPFQNTQPTQAQSFEEKTNHQEFNNLSVSTSVFLKIENTNKYVNINNSGYAVIEDNLLTRYTFVSYKNFYYIVVANDNFKNYYLNYNRNYYIGAYQAGFNARYWTLNNLKIDSFHYPGLYRYSSSGITYLCCNGYLDAPCEIDNVVTVN